MVQQPELRYYPSIVKLLMYAGISLGFVAACFIILSGSHGARSGLNAVMPYVGIGFFGLGVVVFLFQLLGHLLGRRPTLLVESRGIVFHAFWRTIRVRWDEMSDIAIYKQRAGRGNRVYYLVVNVRDPRSMPPSRLRGLSAKLYPSLSKAAISVPLNQLFVRCTATKRDALLRDIYAHFSPQLSHYGILLDERLRSVN